MVLDACMSACQQVCTEAGSWSMPLALLFELLAFGLMWWKTHRKVSRDVASVESKVAEVHEAVRQLSTPPPAAPVERVGLPPGVPQPPLPRDMAQFVAVPESGDGEP